ncbi:glycine cleavage system protein GcvH [Candidatus Halobeggiatoa sp. HSG11]|nr:glycine cleavage system protein GcvH [Candidatus Halobeggiatoa sp. HSG11]
MSETPENLKYTESHEWIAEGDDGSVTIGITDHAQQELGDLVYIELPEVGKELKQEEICGVVESVKAASDIFSPLAGEITAINTELEDAPELVNRSPYQDGWLFKLKTSDSLDGLLSHNEYATKIQE